MDNLISRLDLDHISNSLIVRWTVFFIALGALARVDIDAGRMIFNEDSIYPFLILTLVPLCSILKIGWQAISLVRRCCIPIGIVVCLMNAVATLSDMSSVQSFFDAQKLFYAPLAFGIFLSFLLSLIEPKTKDELNLSPFEICSVYLLLILAVPAAVFSITGDITRTNQFLHVPAMMTLLVIGLICFVYPDFQGYTLIQKAYKASLASVMTFSCYGVALHIYGFVSGSQEVITSVMANSLLGIMYGSLIALFAISAGGQSFQTKDQKTFFDWCMIGFYVFFVLIVLPPPSLLDAFG